VLGATQGSYIRWEFLRYVVFDIPSPSPPQHDSLSTLSPTTKIIPTLSPAYAQPTLPLFEERYSSLLHSISPVHPFIVSFSFQCYCAIFETSQTVSLNKKAHSKEHLQDALHHVIITRGEGVVLRAPRSPYFHGRTEQAIKFKRYAREEEAIVIGIKHDSFLLRL
jgi:hypothetical protein